MAVGWLLVPLGRRLLRLSCKGRLPLLLWLLRERLLRLSCKRRLPLLLWLLLLLPDGGPAA